MLARIGSALTAGLFTPASVTFASVVARSAWQGRAVALVSGGVTAAIALGAPLGTWIGSQVGWRVPFFTVAAISAFATVGMMLGLPHQELRGTVPLENRLAILRRPAILHTLGICTLYALAGLMPYTYLAILVKQAVADSRVVSLLQSIWGVGAVVGIFGGGVLVDRFGAVRVALVMLFLQPLVYISLSMIADAGSTSTDTAFVV